MIFLDADEAFEPPLGKAERAYIEQQFAEKELLALDVQRTNKDPATAAVISIDSEKRILRGLGAVEFNGIIHEQAAARNQKELVHKPASGLNIVHTGYGVQNTPAKLRRNQALLQIALEADMPENEKALHHYYLMRECDALGEPGTAADSLAWLLAHQKALRHFLSVYQTLAVDFIYRAIRLATAQRRRFSRAQVYSSVVDNAQTLLAAHPSAHIIELYYRLHLQYDEHSLLVDFEAAISKAEIMRDGQTLHMESYIQAAAELYLAMATAAWRRRLREVSFDYVSAALHLSGGALLRPALPLLLRCVQGLALQDIVMFLDSLLPLTQAGVLSELVACLHHEGATDLYAYFMKKLLDEGAATKSEFWYLMIVIGKPQQAAEAAWQAKDTTAAEDVAELMFLAIVCADDAALIQKYRSALGEWLPILERYFGGTLPKQFKHSLLHRCYGHVAFAKGRKQANHLLSCFANTAQHSFEAQCRYYMDAGLYTELLHDAVYQPADGERDSMLCLAECELMAERYEEAAARIHASILASGGYEQAFALLQAIAHNAVDSSSATAAESLLYRYSAVHEEYIECYDIINTSALPPQDTKKQRATLTKLSVKDFFADTKTVDWLAPHGYQEVFLQAAEALSAAERYHSAYACYLRLLQYGTNSPDVWNALAAMFEKLNNPALAHELKKRA